MTNWFVSNKLTVNVDKCEAISFGCGKPDKVTILRNELPYQKACKYLGLHLENISIMPQKNLTNSVV